MKTDYNCQKGQKLIIKEKGKLHQVDVEQITHITCSGYVSFVHQADQADDIIVCRLLKDFETELSEDIGFFRANRNTLINLSYMVSYEHNSHINVVMKENIKVIISRRKLHPFLQLVAS